MIRQLFIYHFYFGQYLKMRYDKHIKLHIFFRKTRLIALLAKVDTPTK